MTSLSRSSQGEVEDNREKCGDFWEKLMLINQNIVFSDTWGKYASDSSKLQGNLNFAFDQREKEVNLHNATSSPESPSNASPDICQSLIFIHYKINLK